MVIGCYKEKHIKEMSAKYRELETKYEALRENTLTRRFSTLKGD